MLVQALSLDLHFRLGCMAPLKPDIGFTARMEGGVTSSLERHWRCSSVSYTPFVIQPSIGFVCLALGFLLHSEADVRLRLLSANKSSPVTCESPISSGRMFYQVDKIHREYPPINPKCTPAIHMRKVGCTGEMATTVLKLLFRFMEHFHPLIRQRLHFSNFSSRRSTQLFLIPLFSGRTLSLTSVLSRTIPRLVVLS